MFKLSNFGVEFFEFMFICVIKLSNGVYGFFFWDKDVWLIGFDVEFGMGEWYVILYLSKYVDIEGFVL